jgi:FAD-dependent urate hydroxylase
LTRALIVGGGIAGPVAALALQRAGIEAAIYEARAPTAGDAGSWLTVASNGLDALRAIGADEPVRAAGFATAGIVLLNDKGARLGRIPAGSARHDRPLTITIKRARLHRVLLEQATRHGISFAFGKRLAGVEMSPNDGVIARFGDGTQAYGDLLIGCDGVHSATRRNIDAAAPPGRYVGLVNFGGYTRDLALSVESGVWHMVFGRRAFFGYIRDPGGGIVWFANVPRGQVSDSERDATTTAQWKRQLLDLFADDYAEVARIIRAGALELVADNTYDLASVPAWRRGPMLIIGDAAHAPSPSSGQGASMAIEDAVVLARCLRDSPSVPLAFAAYEKLRRRRVERIVAAGARQSSNKTLGPIGRRIRDLALPFVFRFLVTERSLRWMYEYRIDW